MRSVAVRHPLLVTITALLLSPVTGCGIVGADGYDGVGTVRFLQLEGGCWVLETEQERYEPLDLPDRFRQDGLRVEFSGQVRDDVATVCQVGPVLELATIQRAGD